ncbi:UDP-N-acetylglucosamine transferase subunit ALG14 isoform X3 [Macaca mulatta]
MVCVLILAAAAGAVAAFLILRIWVVLRSRDFTPRESLSILVVAGSGGHTTEILRLLGSLSNAYSPRHYVIADTDEMSANKINSFELDRADRDPSNMYTKYYIHRIPRSREVRQSWPSTVFTTLHSMWLSFPLIHQVKPDLTPSLPKMVCEDLLMNFSSVLLDHHSRTSFQTCPSQEGLIHMHLIHKQP